MRASQSEADGVMMCLVLVFWPVHGVVSWEPWFCLLAGAFVSVLHLYVHIIASAASPNLFGESHASLVA